jgi:hypothetical protein
MSEREEPCTCCDGDGYTETWNDDQSGVVITICPYCSPEEDDDSEGSA